MTAALIPLPTERDLATMSSAECPDLPTTIAAAIAHGLEPRKALDAAFWKWISENQEEVQRFGLANFYTDERGDRAMQDVTRTMRFLCVVVAEQQRQIAALTARLG